MIGNGSDRGLVARLSVLAGAAALALVAPAPASAFHEPVQRAIGQLREGRAAEALETLKKHLDRVGPALSPDRVNQERLATELLYRAVAEYELGAREEARWSWQMALVFHPALQDLDLGALGSAGRFLKVDAAPKFSLSAPLPVRDTQEGGGVSAPKRQRGSFPVFAEELRKRGVEGVVVVHAWIRKDGRVDSPKIANEVKEPGLVYATLEALRDWRYEPARSDGEPIDVWFEIEIRYTLDQGWRRAP
jgi:TonB family protein